MPHKRSNSEMQYRVLGSTGEKVSVIGLGGWHLGLKHVDEQLSVRMTAMRRGIGAALLSAAECVAAKTRSRTLWLTTYRHLPWNAPFYEKAGFVTVPVEECGTEMLVELLFQRRLLPKPDERVAMRKLLSAPN